MWYMAAAWNPNPTMCSQIRGIVRNFIWSGKASNARAKVKWETLTLPSTQGGLGIIDPKAQSEALLAKLLIRGVATLVWARDQGKGVTRVRAKRKPGSHIRDSRECRRV